MAQTQTQFTPRLARTDSFASSLTRAMHTLIGKRHIWSELSAATAHYDGLIDCIERAGWQISHLEQMKHAADATGRKLMSELLDSHPDMSQSEQQSFLAPFKSALQQFARMTAKERAAFQAEYARFTELHAQSLQQFATEEVTVS